jgi:hypothetical protein
VDFGGNESATALAQSLGLILNRIAGLLRDLTAQPPAATDHFGLYQRDRLLAELHDLSDTANRILARLPPPGSK